MSTDTSTTPASAPTRFVNSSFWVALAATAAACLLLLGMAVMRPGPVPPQRLGALPDFTFTRQDGQPFGRAQLLGRPFVANFIFTRCPTICPVFTQKMARLQKLTEGENLALVSFSVDPKYDTPERLTEYAARYHADPARWSFLTGDYTRLQETVVGGFKIAMGRNGEDENDIPSIFHGSHFVLVDGSGEIRGYYNSEDDDAVERLRQDAGWLLGSGG
ncbi:SCO family protein [Melittangium boletus]|uniref:Photosynthetic protein synthase I n=1 Tax=Melittangium boletus DSM 14713 TaxID=1294270 RepID=A0A250ICP8_9BACT|nr:SCO family protein [Melittangium boletus]ATB29629.1 photosynthetic protein synthase I [Melittangium boletus DSM 14713]